MSDFSQWFDGKYIEWQTQRGRSGTLTDFASYLGISQQDASNYKTGRAKPTGDNLFKIALKLGFECYDILEVTPPVSDARLLSLMKSWEKLTDAVKDEFNRMAQQAQSVSYVREKKDGYKTKKRN